MTKIKYDMEKYFKKKGKTLKDEQRALFYQRFLNTGVPNPEEWKIEHFIHWGAEYTFVASNGAEYEIRCYELDSGKLMFEVKDKTKGFEPYSRHDTWGAVVSRMSKAL